MDSFGDTGYLQLLTEVVRCWFCRHSLFGLEPAMNLHSHPMEVAGTLVDDAEGSVVVGGPGKWW